MKRNLLAIFMICILFAVLFGCGANAYQEQINLGYKYIEEGEYEEAILAFNKAIEIDIKKPTAYVGLADTYVTRLDANTIEDVGEALLQGYEQDSARNAAAIADAIIRLADDLVAKDRNEWAITLLDYGYELTRNERIKEKRESMVQELAMPFLEKLFALCETGKIDEAKEQIDSEEFSLVAVCSTKENPILYLPSSNKGVGIYSTLKSVYGHFFVYFGDYDQGIRSGKGIWMAAKDGENYLFEGSWQEDKPNGNGEVKEWYEGLEEGMAVRQKKGTLVDGYWNGGMQWNFIYPSKADMFTLYFSNGIVTVLEADEGPEEEDYTVCQAGSNGNSMTFSADDITKHHGVAGFEDARTD